MVNQYDAINLTWFWHMSFGRQSHAQSFRHCNSNISPSLDSSAHCKLTSVNMRSNVRSALAWKPHMLYMLLRCLRGVFNWPISSHLLFSLLVILWDKHKWHGSQRVFDIVPFRTWTKKGNRTQTPPIHSVRYKAEREHLFTNALKILLAHAQKQHKIIEAFVCTFDWPRFSRASPQCNAQLSKRRNTCHEAMETCRIAHIARDTFESLNS